MRWVLDLPRSGSRVALRLAIAYVAIFLWVGVYMPYWPIWLADRGMSPSEVGILLGVSPWTRVIASPLAGRWADRHGHANWLVTGLAVLLVGMVTCFSLVQGFAGLLLITVAVGLTFAPIVPLADGLTIEAEAEGRLSYGPVRLWGSAAFILASWVGGVLLERHGEAIVLWLLVGAAASIAVVSLLLPAGGGSARTPSVLVPLTSPPDPSAAVPSPSAVTSPSDPSLVGRAGSSSAGSFSAWTWPFVGFLITTALLHASHAVLYGFGTQHWRTQGLDEGTVGLLWAEGVLAEIVLFAAARRVDRSLSPRNLWLLAGAAGVVRWLVLGWTATLPWLVATQALHAFTYGALHLGAMAYIRQRVPPQARGRASTLYSAASAGLAFGIALPLAGLLYGGLGGGAYWVMAGGSALGMLVALSVRDAGARQGRG